MQLTEFTSVSFNDLNPFTSVWSRILRSPAMKAQTSLKTYARSHPPFSTTGPINWSCIKGIVKRGRHQATLSTTRIIERNGEFENHKDRRHVDGVFRFLYVYLFVCLFRAFHQLGTSLAPSHRLFTFPSTFPYLSLSIKSIRANLHAWSATEWRREFSPSSPPNPFTTHWSPPCRCRISSDCFIWLLQTLPVRATNWFVTDLVVFVSVDAFHRAFCLPPPRPVTFVRQTSEGTPEDVDGTRSASTWRYFGNVRITTAVLQFILLQFRGK